MLLTTDKLWKIVPEFANMYLNHTEKEKLIPICEGCGREARLNSDKFKGCAGCICAPSTTYYCSRACQKVDWPAHKPRCQAARDMYQGLDLEGSKRAKYFAKKIQNSVALTTPVFNWAAYQAFMANPQRKPMENILEIECIDFQRGGVLYPWFPVRYRFIPLTSAHIPELVPPTDGKCRGWWVMKSGLTRGIQTVLPTGYDSLDIQVPQWPYIFAQVMLEDETNLDRAGIKLIALVKLALRNNSKGQVLEPFSCQSSDEGWELNTNRLLEWERALKSIL